MDDYDMSTCKRIDHSYTTIPQDYPESVYTGQKGNFCQVVCNHLVVSVPQGSESSFVLKAKNRHEEQLFRIEDERYEIDQAINLNCDVIKILENAFDEIQNGNPENFTLDPKIFTKPRISWIYQI